MVAEVEWTMDKLSRTCRAEMSMVPRPIYPAYGAPQSSPLVGGQARAAACASPPPPKPNSPQHLLFLVSCSPHSSAHTLTAALRLRNPSNHALLGGDKGSTEGSVQHHTREPLAATISQLGLFSRYQQRLSPTSTPCLCRPFLAVGPTRLQRWARLKEGARATTCPTGY